MEVRTVLHKLNWPQGRSDAPCRSYTGRDAIGAQEQASMWLMEGTNTLQQRHQSSNFNTNKNYQSILML